MIKSSKRLYAPFFDKENEDYELYIQIGEYSEELEKYFLTREIDNNSYPWDLPEFDILAYLDVLIAPAYVFKKLQNRNYSYEQNLVTLFFKLFKTPSDYENIMIEKSNDVLDHLNISIQIQSKQHIEEILAGIKSKIGNVCEILKDHVNELDNREFILISLNVAELLANRIRVMYANILVTPEEAIRCEYFIRNKHKPWEFNPFAFFSNVIYNDGIDIVKDAWTSYISIYDEEPAISFEKFLKTTFQIEAEEASANLLHWLKSKKNFNDGIGEISATINQLNADSCSFQFNNDFQRALAIIVNNVLAVHKTNVLNTDIYPSPAYYEGIFSSDFLEGLVGSEIQDDLGNKFYLFKVGDSFDNLRDITISELRAFIGNKFEVLPKIVQTELENPALSYLLIKLIQHGAFFTAASICNSKKLYLSGLRFDRNAFDQAVYRLGIKMKEIKNKEKDIDAEKKKQYYFKAIDRFFA